MKQLLTGVDAPKGGKCASVKSVLEFPPRLGAVEERWKACKDQRRDECCGMLSCEHDMPAAHLNSQQS